MPQQRVLRWSHPSIHPSPPTLLDWISQQIQWHKYKINESKANALNQYNFIITRTNKYLGRALSPRMNCLCPGDPYVSCIWGWTNVVPWDRMGFYLLLLPMCLSLWLVGWRLRIPIWLPTKLLRDDYKNLLPRSGICCLQNIVQMKWRIC